MGVDRPASAAASATWTHTDWTKINDIAGGVTAGRYYRL